MAVVLTPAGRIWHRDSQERGDWNEPVPPGMWWVSRNGPWQGACSSCTHWLGLGNSEKVGMTGNAVGNG